MIKGIQIKLLIITMIVLTGGCSKIEDAYSKVKNAILLIKIEERLSSDRCIVEVYQNGIKIDERCYSIYQSYSEDGIYYKKTNKSCTEQRDL